MDIFGIKKFLFKVLLLIATVVTIICVCNGCMPGKAALTQKEITKSSNDSITFGDGFVVDPVELMAAKAAEKEKIIRAEKEPWRIIAYSFALPIGIGLVCGIILMIIWIKAYLAKSPWEKFREEKV